MIIYGAAEIQSASKNLLGPSDRQDHLLSVAPIRVGHTFSAECCGKRALINLTSYFKWSIN